MDRVGSEGRREKEKKKEQDRAKRSNNREIRVRERTWRKPG
jgi:hypothetical protein